MNTLWQNKIKDKLVPEFLSGRSFATRGPMGRHFGAVISMAVGAGVLAGATGVLLYHYLYGRRYIFVLERNINKLGLSVAELRREFENLSRSLKYRRKNRHNEDKGQKNNASRASSIISNFTDASMYSAAESSDEFCDITDSEEEFTTKSPTSIQSIIEDTVKVSGNMDSVELDRLLDGNDAEKLSAHEQLLKLNESKPNDCEILWRLARACHVVGSLKGAKGDQKKKQQYILEGVEYAKKALDIDKNNAMAHKWYAICVGARGQFSSTKEKITDGIVFKEHVEEAIKLDPSDPILYNLLARFEFEVSTLSSVERRVAGWLFAEVPKGSVEEAIKGFKKAEELNPKAWKENRLLLAKCYIHQSKYAEAVSWLDKALEIKSTTSESKYAEAVSWLDKALEIKSTTSEEEAWDQEINKLLKKYGSYRGK